MKHLLVFAALTVLAVAPSAPVWAQTAPDLVIKSAADELANALAERRDELQADEKALYELVNGILAARFDRRYAAQLVLAKHWRSASEEQRAAFIDTFYDTLLRRYADGVLQFDEDRMTVLPYNGDDSKKRTTVKTEVVLNNGSEVPVNYGLVKRKDGWKVYDVTIEGISYVRNFRTEMNAEISAKGLDAVIERLKGEAGG